MEEVYSFRKHSHYLIIHFETDGINCQAGTNTSEDGPPMLPDFVKYHIIYDRKNKEIIHGAIPMPHKHFTKLLNQIKQEENEDHVEIENLMQKLYCAFEKSKSSWNEEDTVMKHLMSNYIRLLVNYVKKRNRSLDTFNYLCVVPREWDQTIREQLLRPIFIQAGLILETDHDDRLLFISDIESIFYAIQTKKINPPLFGSRYFKAGNHHILYKNELLENKAKVSEDKPELSIKFGLIEAQPSLFDSSERYLCPRILFSSACIMSEKNIKSILGTFLELKLFPGDTNANQSILIQTITEYIYNNIKSIEDMFGKENMIYILKASWIIVEEKWMLDEPQSNYLESLNMYDICLEISKNTLKFRIGSYPFNTTRQCDPFLWYEPMPFRDTLFLWSGAVIETVIHSLRLTNSNIAHARRSDTRLVSTLSGGSNYLQEVIRNSDIKSRPCILSSKEPALSTSFFPNQGADVIINIDISFNSTLLSYSLVNDNGIIEMILDNNYFISKKCLPPLKSFFKFSDIRTTLMVNKQCIELADNYLFNDSLNSLFVSEYYSQKTENLLIRFEDILENIHSNEETLVSTQEPKYIKTFLLMYFTYINELVVSGLHQLRKSQNKKPNIGFLISIEKRLLDSIIGTKENLKTIIYKSGLVGPNDKYNKLRIVMQGEGLFSVIQRRYKLRFSIKSCFLLAQLHEDYVQLTLNQIVTEDEMQEAITLQDEIISVQNIYDSLCNKMWENLTQNTSLIQVCKDHCENDEYLHLWETKTQFITHLRKFISEKILERNNDLKFDDTEIIQLGSTCNCVVLLSIRDIIEISFKPVLRDIASIVSSSLVNKKYFGLYNNIEYIFSMIYFNNNRHFQTVLVDLLGEDIVSINETKSVDPYILVLPELPNLLLHPIIHQQSLYYKSFLFGDLQQTSNTSYGFNLEVRKSNPLERKVTLYREKETKRLINADHKVFILIKKGDIINNAGVKKVLYCNFSLSCIKCTVDIAVYKLNGLKGLEFNGTIPENLKDEWVDSIPVDFEEHDLKESLPLMVSVETKGHSSSIKVSGRTVGQDSPREWKISSEVGELMVLERF